MSLICFVIDSIDTVDKPSVRYYSTTRLAGGRGPWPSTRYKL